MTVHRANRAIREAWVHGICENCGSNPREIKMVDEPLISGDPKGKYRSKKRVRTCPRCGYTRTQ